MTASERILVMAHGHPEIIRGGGEIAAYQSFQAYKDQPNVKEAWFLAATDRGQGATGRMSMHRRDEYLWEQGLSDLFRMTATNRHEVTGSFAELLRDLKPTIIHTHHFFKFGLEYLKVIKDIDPNIQTVLTLHEYIAICPNAGQMKDPATGALCQSGDHATHQNCAPDQSAEDLWLRYRRFINYFSYVDHFIAPSEFLRQRYIEWGIPPDKITHVPNGQPPMKTCAPRLSKTRDQFAYFGQLNAHKGIDVLLNALRHLDQKGQSVTLQIHGANLEFQPKAFQKKIKGLAKPLEENGQVLWMGSYTPDEIPSRMAQADWVCVPSLWYENAPMVIQEAFAQKRPVLTTDIGGMAEMVTHDQDGLHLPRGNYRAWADTMHALAMDNFTWDRLHTGISKPMSTRETTRKILTLCAQMKKAIA